MMKAAMDIVTVCYYTDVLCTTFMLLIMLFTNTVTIKIILYTTVSHTVYCSNTVTVASKKLGHHVFSRSYSSY